MNDCNVMVMVIALGSEFWDWVCIWYWYGVVLGEERLMTSMMVMIFFGLYIVFGLMLWIGSIQGHLGVWYRLAFLVRGACRVYIITHSIYEGF